MINNLSILSLRLLTFLHPETVIKRTLGSVGVLIIMCGMVINAESQQGLQSKLFQGDAALNAAAVSDQAHVIPGARGPHIGRIQNALIQLDNAAIDSAEIQQGFYGPSTANAVLAYKQRRSIINHSYQSQADNIVGKMTIARLDREMQEKENASPPAGSPAIAPVPPPPPQADPSPSNWTKGMWVSDGKFSANGAMPIGCLRTYYCQAKGDMIIGADERVESTPSQIVGGSCTAGGGPIDTCNACLTAPPQDQCKWRIIKK